MCKRSITDGVIEIIGGCGPMTHTMGWCNQKCA